MAEVRGRDHEHRWADPALYDLAGDDHDVVVGHAVGRDQELDPALPQRRPSLGLDRKVRAVGQAVKQPIYPSIQKRPKDVKVSPRLFHQKGPQPVLKNLAGGTRLVAGPGLLHAG
ncbi:MAG: hypothetical protein E6I00_13940 [Chloroflexi bacterium]|nr:MAG: hypothetical protein E6I00_13940 [Chloroflexota bacterium]